MFSWLRTPVHVSWRIATLCLGVTSGVIASATSDLWWVADGVWLVVGLLIAAIGLVFKPRWILLLLLIAGGVIGLWRGMQERVGVRAYEGLIDQTVTVTGIVAEDPDVDSRGQTVLRLKEVEILGRSLPGMVWVSAPRHEQVQRSDSVTVQGQLKPGFGSFAGVMYRATIMTVKREAARDIAVDVRNWFANAFRSVVGEPQASLGLGFLLGLRRALPPELLDALKIAGLTHVIVASGYNLTILVRFARRLLAKRSKFWAFAVAGALVLAFIMITGMSPSMSRAGLVAFLSLLAWYYGRSFHPVILLFFVAALSLLINPSYGWNDLGWALSFLSFAGVMILAPLLQAYFFGDKKPGTVRQILGETFSAQLVTAPLLIMTFGQISVVGLLANLLILPFVPLAMLLTFITGIVTAVVPMVGAWLALPTEWLLGAMVAVAQWCAGLPGAVQEVTLSGWGTVAVYGVILLVVWYLQRATRYDLKRANIVE